MHHIYAHIYRLIGALNILISSILASNYTRINNVLVKYYKIIICVRISIIFAVENN